jgi:hypothetical protein
MTGGGKIGAVAMVLAGLALAASGLERIETVQDIPLTPPAAEAAG